MVLKLRGRLTFKVQGFVTVLFDMVLKQYFPTEQVLYSFVTVLFDMVLKPKMSIMHLLGVFFILL